MFRPLPKHLKADQDEICNHLAARKDVDCMTDLSNAGVFTGKKLGFAPCTPQACMEILDYYGIKEISEQDDRRIKNDYVEARRAWVAEIKKDAEKEYAMGDVEREVYEQFINQLDHEVDYEGNGAL